MAMNATLQVRMDDALKRDAEALYAGLGTSFAEAVRVFARQSLIAGGFPFRPALKTWEEYTEEEINERLTRSMAEVAAGHVIPMEELDRMIQEKYGFE